MALLLILIALWIASSVGQVIVGRLNVAREHPLERFVYASALGLGLAAYGVFALGMVGLLSPLPVGSWWVALGVAGIGGMRVQARELKQWIARWRWGTQSASKNMTRWVNGVCIAALLVMGVIAVLACFRPPGAIEWDVLSYHLADPKVFVLQHRITVLPTDHHSNFPLTMEMLFAVGLLFNGFALANLFHLTTAILAVLAIIAFCHRFFNTTVGLLAAVLFATTPVVLWEASVAYIDVAGAFYSSLGIFAALSALALARRRPSHLSQTDDSPVGAQPEMEPGPAGGEEGAGGWMALAGAAMGVALGIKYLALIPFALLALLLVARRMPWRIVALYAGVAIVIASPWYIKNVVWMHNPVYPYYYKLFPHSRYWSLDREISYRSEQEGFGYPHSPSRPHEALLNLMETPWNLVSVNMKGGASRYYNQGEFTFCALIGGLYAGLCLALPFLRRNPRAVSDLGWLVLLQLVVWFFLSQIGRYLIQILPLAAVISGYAAWRISLAAGRRHPIAAINRGLVALLFAGQFVYVIWSLCSLPTGGREAQELETATGLLPTALSLPETLGMIADPATQDDYLRHHLDVYTSQEWVNRESRPGEGVILYDETRGFYLDRPYLWGNGKHSSYIPYDSFRDGADLTDWLQRRNYRYAIINLNWSPVKKPDTPIGPDEAPALLQQWSDLPERWRALVGDAIRKGLWTVADAEHGCVVLRIGGSGIGADLSSWRARSRRRPS